MFKKPIALILAIAVLLVALPMSFTASAAVPNITDINYTAGDVLWEFDASKISSAPSWTHGLVKNGWAGGGSTSLAYNAATSAVRVTGTALDGIVYFPAITGDSANYIFEVSYNVSGAASSAGLAINATADSGATYFPIYADTKNNGGYEAYYRRKGTSTINQTFYQGDYVQPVAGATTPNTLKLVVIDGYTYAYSDGQLLTLAGGVQGVSDPNAVENSINLGMFVTNTQVDIYKIKVSKVKLLGEVDENVIGTSGDKVMTKGDSLMAYDFTTSSVADGSLPAGFTYGGANATPALGWGWGASSASVAAKMTTYQGSKYLQFTAVNCDALIAAPAVNTRDYVYEITFIPTVSNAYVGVSNQTWGTDTLSSSQWFAVTDSKAPYHKYKGTDNSGGNGEFTTEDTFRAALGEEVTLKVVSYDGTNYYFINDRYVTGCKYMGSLGADQTTDRPGLYTYNGNVYIKSMYVNEVEVKEQTAENPEITVPDELKGFDVSVGDSVLDVDFTKSELNSGLPEGWYALLGGTGNNAQVGWGNAGGYGAKVESKNGSNMLHFTSWNCDSYLLSPKLEVSDYVYEAVIVPNGTGYTGLANNAYGTDNTDIKDIQWFCFDDAEAIYWKSYNSGTQKSTKLDAAASNNIKYTAGTEYKLSIYSYDGVNYYYINDTFIFSADQSNPNTDKDFDRVGFYAYPGDFFIKSVNVNKLESANTLPDGIGQIGDEYYFIGDVIYENNFDNETVGTLPEGWSYGWPHGTGNTKTSYGWALNTSATASAQVVNHATHGKVVQFGSTNTDAFMALPATGTMNYVYEATVVVNTNGNSIGHANNFYGATYEGSGAMYNCIYPNSTSNKAKFTYRGSGTGADWTTNFSPANGDELKLKIVSLNGNNYIFYNGVQVAVAPWRGGAGESDNPGFYTYNGNMLVKDVKVSSVGTAIFDLDAARVSVDEDKKAYLEFDFSFDKSQASYDKYVDGDYVAEGAEDFILGFLFYVGDENIADTLTAETENVGIKILPDAAITQNEDMLYAHISEQTPADSYKDWANVRPFVKVDGIYFYGEGAAYTVANLANGAYESANNQAQKDLIAEVFGSYDEFVVGPGAKELTFTLFSDFHYKAGMYSTTMADLRQILKRADDTNSAFIMSGGDMCNDLIGSPELTKTYLQYMTEEGQLLTAYNIYGNHELESANNSMEFVTPRLTNDITVTWGDGTVGRAPANLKIAYYYFEENGFRIVCLDNNYDYNPNHYKNPDGSMGAVVGWEHYLTCSYGGTSAASNANRGFYEGANALANNSGGSLGDVQMAWLEDVLLDAAANDIPCIVVGHTGYSGLGFGGGSSDSEKVREVYRKANAANPGTVLVSINGHIHTDNQGWNEGVFYFDTNTVRNNWWQSSGSNHYGPEHTFMYEEYDSEGNLIDTYEKSLGSLSMASQTWFSHDPLSCVMTVNDAGIVTVDGMESKWAYDIVPDAANPELGVECLISSGIFWNCDLYGHIEKFEIEEAVTFSTNSSVGHYVECQAAGCDYRSATVAHTFDQKVESEDFVDSKADCNNAASYYYSCVCGEAGDQTFTVGSATGHDPATDWTSDANGHWHACGNNCGEKLDYAAHTFDQRVETSEYSAGSADCTKPAQFYFSCVCGEAGDQTFDSGTSMGHSPKTDWVTDENNHWHECNNCDEKLDLDAHLYDQRVVNDTYKNTDADCDNAATYFYSCVCGKAGTQFFSEGNPAAHVPATDWTSDADGHWHECANCDDKLDYAAHSGGEATCTDKAVCDDCGTAYGDVDPDNHDLKDVPAGEASHDNDGNIAHKKCNDCDKLFDDAGNELAPEDVIVDGGDHDYGDEYKSDEDGHWKECECGGKDTKADHTFGEWEVKSEPSAVTPGEKTRECSVCGFEETAFIPATQDTPDTGDKFVPFIWLAVLLMSGAGLSFVAAYRVRRKQR